MVRPPGVHKDCLFVFIILKTHWLLFEVYLMSVNQLVFCNCRLYFLPVFISVVLFNTLDLSNSLPIWRPFACGGGSANECILYKIENYIKHVQIHIILSSPHCMLRFI